MASQGSFLYSICHTTVLQVTQQSQMNPQLLYDTQKPLLGSMNWSLNHNSAPTVVTIVQWLGLKALNPPQLPQASQLSP